MGIDSTLFNFFHNFLLNFPAFQVIFFFFAKYFFYLVVLLILIFIFKIKDVKQKLSFFLYFLLSFLLSRHFFIPIIYHFLQIKTPLEYFGVYKDSVLNLKEGLTPSLFYELAFLFSLSLIFLSLDRKKIALYIIILSFIFSISRVIVGLSWLSDLLINLAVGYLIYLIYKAFFERKILNLKKE